MLQKLIQWDNDAITRSQNMKKEEAEVDQTDDICGHNPCISSLHRLQTFRLVSENRPMESEYWIAAEKN